MKVLSPMFIRLDGTVTEDKHRMGLMNMRIPGIKGYEREMAATLTSKAYDTKNNGFYRVLSLNMQKVKIIHFLFLANNSQRSLSDNTRLSFDIDIATSITSYCQIAPMYYQRHNTLVLFDTRLYH